MNTQPRAARRAALATLITRLLEKDLPHEDEKAALALALGEAVQVLSNLDRIAVALERIAAGVEEANKV